VTRVPFEVASSPDVSRSAQTALTTLAVDDDVAVWAASSDTIFRVTGSRPIAVPLGLPAPGKIRTLLCRPDGSVRAVTYGAGFLVVDGDEIVIEWVESDGPPVERPSHPGRGLGLARGFARHDLAGNIELDFAPAGLRVVIRLPAVLS